MTTLVQLNSLITREIQRCAIYLSTNLKFLLYYVHFKVYPNNLKSLIRIKIGQLIFFNINELIIFHIRSIYFIPFMHFVFSKQRFYSMQFCNTTGYVLSYVQWLPKCALKHKTLLKIIIQLS